MEAIGDIQLPPVIPNENEEEQPSSPDNTELNSTNNLPTINTDNLPIIPLRNKRWLNKATPTSDSPKTKISLNITPLSKSPSTAATKVQDGDKSPFTENLNSSYNELSNLNLPNTDNLLDINVPKTTLLGKEQAKKRLHAFSLAKQNSLNASPLSKKKNVRQPKFLLQPSEDKYNENGEKTEEKFVLVKKPARKSANPNEKAKAVIEEIEEIKKIESAYLEALEQGLLDQRNRRSRSKSRSRERSKRRSSRKERKRSQSEDNKSKKGWEKPKYPVNWAEVNRKGYDLETLANFKAKEHRNKDNEAVDYRKQLLFQTPSLPLHCLTIKGVNGKEKSIPAEYVRFTNKTPRVSYSAKEKTPNDFYSRKCVLQYVPKVFRDAIKKIAHNSTFTIDSDSPAKITNRKWFPKTTLSKVEDNTECKILETSLGLSFLQTYSDGDEQEKEINEDEEIDTTPKISTEDRNYAEKINKSEVVEEVQEQTLEKGFEEVPRSEKLETTVEKIELEEEIEEKVEKHEKIKKRKKKEKKKHKSKPKKEKHKKKKKKKKTKLSKESKHEKVKKRKNSTADEDKNKRPDKRKEQDNKKVDDNRKVKTEIDESKKSKRNRSKSSESKSKTRSSSKEEKSDKVTKAKRRTSSGDAHKLIKEEGKTDPVVNKSDSLKRESRKNKPDQPKEKEKRDHSQKRSSERSKTEEKHKSKSRSRERKSKKSEKEAKSKPPKNEKETRKVKCVAEKEFGTPDTEEYYSNWESDVELGSNLEKRSTELHNQSASINQSWQSDDDPLEISDITISDIPLVKSPFKDDKSPLVSQRQSREKSVEQPKRTYKRDKSTERTRRSSLRDRSSSPLRSATRPRHLDNFPLGISPIQNEFSPIPKQFSPMQLSPTPNDFSPFRNRCIEERRRSRRSMERSPPEKFLEMPLNIRNTRSSYSRNKWEEERFDGSKYNRSPEHVEFPMRTPDDNKMYALYADNAWERDDYLTIKTEEMKLEEERRTLIEERRKLEIERRKFEELERQRYYNRMTEFDEERCGFEERRQEEFKISDDEEKRYRAHRDYREVREHPTYSKEKDASLSRRSSEDQRSRRRYSPERSQELQRDRVRDNFSWEDAVENKRTEKYLDKPQEQEPSKRQRKSRWQNIDDLEPLHHEPYVRTEQETSHIKNESNKNEPASSNKTEHKSYSKEKKIARKNRWESSEDEIIIVRDDKKSNRESSEKVQNKQKQHKDTKDFKQKEKRDKERSLVVNREKHKRTYKREEENREKSLTDNLDLPTRKPIIPRTSTQAMQKPEVLENEYEKFMQALGSEISTAEEISEKDFEQQKRKSKLSDKRVKKRQSYSRSVSISSDEEFEKSSRKEVRKRKVKKRVSSSSSSSTSSSSSGSDSSTDSSSITSSSEFSSSEEKRKKLKKHKVEAVKVKIENTEVQQKDTKSSESKLKSTPSDMSKFDVIVASRIKEKEVKEVIKMEDPEDLHHVAETQVKAFSKPDTSKAKLVSPNKTPKNVGVNLNIINLTIPEFSLGEIPLPNAEISKPVLNTSEVPLPVPSPKLSLITSINDPVLQKIDQIVTKIEPIAVSLPKKELIAPETDLIAPILPEIVPVLPEIAPVPPVTPTFAPNTPTFESEMSGFNTNINVYVDTIKEEPTTPEDKFLTNPTQIDMMASPTKRNNLIPIKFLTAELRKQANESPHLKPLGTIEAKESLVETNQISANEVKTNAALDKGDFIEALPLTNRKRHFAMSSINLPAKRPLLDESEHDENSTDFTDRFIRKDEKDDSFEEVSTSNVQFIETIDSTGQAQSSKIHPSREKSFERESTSREYGKARRKLRSISPRRKRDLSPRSNRRDSRSPRHTKRWSKDMSPRRWDRDGSPRRGSRNMSTRRSRRNSISPGRKEGRRDLRSLSPRDPGTKKHMSPRYRSPSPKRRSTSREFSPRRHRSKDRSSSKEPKLESIQETLQRIAGVDKYRSITKHSPISSPLHGFKRSVADSTISDEQLLQRNSEGYAGSPGYTTECFKNTVSHSPSPPPPKRMSLDERINQALGLADQQPKPISTTYSENFEFDPQYFDQYGQYYEQYVEQNQKSEMYGQSSHGYRQSRQRENSNLKVVQVGNVLQVVPTEDVPPKPPPVQQNKITNSTQKIVQVGNMLQIVPTTTLPEVPAEKPTIPLPPPLPAPSTPTPSISSIKDPLNAETLIKQKVERRAEKDKRRQERERKRKEKEKKRKEREKRKQLKVKLQTEAMIKQALIQETEEVGLSNEENINLENTSECQGPVQWPPAPQIVCNSSYKPAGKGILCQGPRISLNEEGDSKPQLERRKSVKFSDGVMPGEGTSPSGGEDLSSPPPAPKKLPKEKRFIKTKIPKKIKVPKKKKVKVKVIRQQQTQGPEDDEEEDDNLPPPPPPPGSPPPHLFPARVKHPVINNIHPNVVVSIANPPLQSTSFPPPPVYRPGVPPQPPAIMSHHGHHHCPPQMPPFGLPHHGHGNHHGPGNHHQPPPCPPPHHGGFNPPMIVPPVIAVVPSPPGIMPPFQPPHHNHHHHHGGHHHHGHHQHH